MEIHNYSIWHQSFYNRPSVFSSGSLPKHKIPPADILSQINVAAKYVAFNGAHSERHLLGMHYFSSFIRVYLPHVQNTIEDDLASYIPAAST